MAIQTFNDVIFACKKGSTWGTEADLSASPINVYASAISIGGGFADFLPRDFGQSGKRTNNARLQADFNCTLTFDLTYGQGYLVFIAGVMGTESSPAEQTVGEADYLTNIDLADSTSGLYYTLCWSIESDRVLAIPSFKPTGFTITQAINGAGQVTVRGIADRVIESSSNTVAELTAATDYEYETATLGSTNHYFRVDSYSTGTALTSDDDKTITNYTIAVDRPMVQRRGLRAALTPYTLEPLQIGPIDASLQVTMPHLDNADYDMFGQWVTPTFLMSETFVDGSAIAGGVNRSLKFQCPYMKVKGALPTGHDVQSNNGIFNPTISYDLLKTSAAPAGMSGVSDLLRIVTIGPTRSAKWGT